MDIFMITEWWSVERTHTSSQPGITWKICAKFRSHIHFEILSTAHESLHQIRLHASLSKSYLFYRIQAILESVFFQESRSFSSQDSEVGACCVANSWIRILRRMPCVWTVTHQPLPSLQFDDLSVRSHYPAKEQSQIEVALKVDTSWPIWHYLQWKRITEAISLPNDLATLLGFEEPSKWVETQ
jgi:hypothetical protein